MIGTVLSRYAAVNDRVRVLLVERLDLMRTDTASDRGNTSLPRERVAEIDAQLPLLLRRHRMLQQASVTLYAAAMILVGSMVTIGVGAIVGRRPWGTISLLVFLLGTLVMIGGLAVVVRETGISNDALRLEVERVQGLDRRTEGLS